MPIFLFIFLLLGLGLSDDFNSSIARGHETSHRNLVDAQYCPLKFDVLRKLITKSSQHLAFLDIPTECQYLLQGIRLVRSMYLQTTGFFVLPSNTSEACWDSYQVLINEFIGEFDIRTTCGFSTSLMTEDCMNISTNLQFESLIPKSQLGEIRLFCNQSLKNTSPCSSCKNILSSLQSSYFRDPDIRNVSDCAGYPIVYAAALVNQFGPTDLATAKCLFSLNFCSTNTSSKRRKIVMYGILTGCIIGFLGAVVVVWFLWRRHKKWGKKNLGIIEMSSVTIGGSITLVRFTFEEIKKATGNFSRENIIGLGGYGNVYKGKLLDGSEVAVKRFKNCSVTGDASFMHEVDVISSIRHVNLVGLRGYCTATVPLEGHQRIIVCELMHNGCLYDHLFGSGVKKLTWPIRQKIALGTARGLAYLHYGAQPAIIHRDVKASNILLDETFEPKLADFGLAKFTPEGLTHFSTRVAGTLGYVAPEYALYGQLTDRSDVYSFGVVLLELLSGKKAVISAENGETLLLTDWAWSLVKEGRVFDVIEDGMPNLAPPEIMEKYVLVAILSAHPLRYARPTIDQIMKILETNFPVPSIPKHPFPLLDEIEDIEISASFTGSYYTSCPVDHRQNEGTLQ